MHPRTRRADMARAAAVAGLYALGCIEGINGVLRRKPRYARMPHVSDWVYFYRAGSPSRTNKRPEAASGWFGPRSGAHD